MGSIEQYLPTAIDPKSIIKSTIHAYTSSSHGIVLVVTYIGFPWAVWCLIRNSIDALNAHRRRWTPFVLWILRGCLCQVGAFAQICTRGTGVVKLPQAPQGQWLVGWVGQTNRGGHGLTLA